MTNQTEITLESILEENTFNKHASDFLTMLRAGVFNDKCYNIRLDENDRNLVKYSLPNGKEKMMKTSRFILALLGSPSGPDAEEIAHLFADNQDTLELSFSLEDIMYGYHYHNYASLSGTLGNSCMKYTRCQYYVESLYKDICGENGIVGILLSKDNRGFVTGRSLIWKTNDGWVMDRIYTVKDNIFPLFKRFAYKHPEIKFMKYKQDHASATQFIELSTNTIVYKTFKVIIPRNIEVYPYMDTFRQYNSYTGELSNDGDSDSTITMTSTNIDANSRNTDTCRFTGNTYHRRHIISTFRGAYSKMSTDTAIYIPNRDGYVSHEITTVTIYNGGIRKYLPEDCLEITIGQHKDKHILKTEAVILNYVLNGVTLTEVTTPEDVEEVIIGNVTVNLYKPHLKNIDNITVATTVPSTEQLSAFNN